MQKYLIILIACFCVFMFTACSPCDPADFPKCNYEIDDPAVMMECLDTVGENNPADFAVNLTICPFGCHSGACDEPEGNELIIYNWEQYRQDDLTDVQDIVIPPPTAAAKSAALSNDPEIIEEGDWCCIPGSGQPYCVNGDYIGFDDCPDDFLKACEAWGITPNWIQGCSVCLTNGLTIESDGSVTVAEGIAVGPALEAMIGLCGDVYPNEATSECLGMKDDLCCNTVFNLPICSAPVCTVGAKAAGGCCPTEPAGRWEPCNGFCCDTKYTECKPGHWTGAEASKYCAPKDTCKAPDKKKCANTKYPACCDADENCAVVKVKTPLGWKNVDACSPVGCTPGEEENCGKDGAGNPICCKDPFPECIPNPDNIKHGICQPKDDDDCSVNGEVYCHGSWISTCCPPGKCAENPRGMAFCLP